MPTKKTFKVGKKGTKSKTHKGDLDFTTKRGDKVFHRRGHDVRERRQPYSQGYTEYLNSY